MRPEEKIAAIITLAVYTVMYLTVIAALVMLNVV